MVNIVNGTFKTLDENGEPKAGELKKYTGDKDTSSLSLAGTISKGFSGEQLSNAALDAMREKPDLHAKLGLPEQPVFYKGPFEKTVVPDMAYQQNRDVPAQDAISENYKNGLNAMNEVISKHTDVLNAMFRDDVGSISFYWGTPGKGARLKGGSGVSHLIARRGSQEYDCEAVARKMVEVLAYGKMGEEYGPEGGQHRNVTYNGYTAVLSLYRFGDLQTWLLTGWKDYSAGDARTGNGSAPTQTDPSGIQEELGATESDGNISPIGIDGKPLFQPDNSSLSSQEDAAYFDAIERGDMDAAREMVRRKAEENGFSDAIPEQTDAYRVRTKPAPKKTIKVYKVFTLAPDGSPTALFVAGTEKLPQGVWLDAVDTWHFTAENGRAYIPSTQNPNTEGGKTGESVRIPNDEVRQELIRRGFLPKGSTAEKVTALAYRPGWHAGTMPFFPQGGKKASGSAYGKVHRRNQVVFECELAFDKDYTEEAESQPKARKKDGSLNTREADLKRIPEDGAYYYATNPMTHGHPELGLWAISGSMKIGRALTQEECDAILKENGLAPQEWEGGEDGMPGRLDLGSLGYEGPQADAARKTLAPVTYDDGGNVIPLSRRFDRGTPDVRYSIEAGTNLPPASGRPGIAADEVRKTVNKLTSQVRNGCKVEIVQSAKDLPERIQSQLGGKNVEGVYVPSSDTVYLIADNIASVERAAEVYMHEAVVHHGLRALFTQQKMRDVLHSLFMQLGGMNHAGIRETAGEYGVDPRKGGAAEAKVMEEFIARLAEGRANGRLNKADQTAFGKFIEIVRKAWNSIVRSLTGKQGTVDASSVEKLIDSLEGYVFDGKGSRDNKKSRQWLTSTRLQLPWGGSNTGDKGNVFSEQDLVKAKNDNQAYYRVADDQAPMASLLSDAVNRVLDAKPSRPSAGYTDSELASNPNLASARAKIGTKPQSIREKWNAATEDIKTKLEQGIFDSFASIKDYSKEGYVMAHLTTNLGSQITAMMVGGHPVWNDGAMDVQGKSLIDVFSPVEGEMDRFLEWMVARRANRLMQEGREHNFTQEEIDALLKNNQGKMASGKSRADVYRKVFDDFADYLKTSFLPGLLISVSLSQLIYWVKQAKH